MPSQILHILFGEDVLKALAANNIIPGFSPENFLQGAGRCYFALGCQGPDIFYHSQGRRPVALEYGTLLHRRGAGSMSGELLARTVSPAFSIASPLGAYALGFATHGFLDRKLHPYIVYKTYGDRSVRSGAHAFFERIIDILMLNILRFRGIASWDNEEELAALSFALHIGDPPEPHLKTLLMESLVSRFPERAGRDGKLFLRMDNAFADCASFYRRTDPRRPEAGEGIFPAYRYPRRFSLAEDYLNLAGKPWRDPSGFPDAEDIRSVPALYQEAITEAAKAIGALFRLYRETGVFPRKAAGEILGDMGLSIRDEAGKPAAVLFSDALDWERILGAAKFS